MIKKIQQESGARVQFTPDDGHSQDRTCSITGPADRVQQAVNMIQDLIQSTAVCCVLSFAFGLQARRYATFCPDVCAQVVER